MGDVAMLKQLSDELEAAGVPLREPLGSLPYRARCSCTEPLPPRPSPFASRKWTCSACGQGFCTHCGAELDATGQCSWYRKVMN